MCSTIGVVEKKGGVSYLVEDIMIDGFEIFQSNTTTNTTTSTGSSKDDDKWIVENRRRVDNLKVEKVSRLDLSLVRPGRGGVVLSATWNGVKYLGMGEDWKTGEITDFGGGLSYVKLAAAGGGEVKKVKVKRRHGRKRGMDKDAVLGSMREYLEESLGVFPR